ncbi:3-dehydroquinate synthase [Paucisalibacillus sp. EB02]|uniref:3-dehydroquinate synthase n=1 Tax=Paucisalibacillus sp. EB02 TaxID=1347087 RepID=UPI0004BAFE30|nr:3-dehydroquinate synthase [Paucisalibacillus sp. EB02]
MNIIHVNSVIQSYDIIIGNKIRHLVGKYLPKSYSAILIITDSNVANLYVEDIVHGCNVQDVFVEVVSPGEQAKNINTYYNLQSKAIEYQLDRKSLIIALGGGVIGDLAGFVAATFMRGIDYVQIPTTILAHDSSVGGKVAINHESGKNLIGSFYPPVLVFYDTDMLKTLPEREIRSGYAELIKEAMLADSELLERLWNVSLPEVHMEETTYFLERGISIKADIVEQDERESGKRMFLNLGHTLGHALETKLGYGVITHGEAVAIGLLFALFVSNRELKADLPIHALKTWLIKNRYPLVLSLEMIDDLVKIMKYDKKTIYKQIQMVLLQGISAPVIHMIDDSKLKKYLTAFVMEEMKEGI